jgi:hypothetical protein
MAADKKSTTVDAVVASGRTLQDADGKTYGPGSTVTLTSDEATSLLAAGFLDGGSDNSEIASGSSMFNSEDGPQVTEQ